MDKTRRERYCWVTDVVSQARSRDPANKQVTVQGLTQTVESDGEGQAISGAAFGISASTINERGAVFTWEQINRVK